MADQKPPREEFERDIIAAAVEWRITRFLGRGQFLSSDAPTFDLAIVEAKKLLEDPTGGTRPAMIHAVNKHNHSAMVATVEKDGTVREVRR